MRLEEVEAAPPKSGQALVKISVAGVNFIDIYFRTGLYKADLPLRLGMEAAGIVEAVGPDVSEVQPGDRVAYAMERGSYAEYALVPSRQLVKLPERVDDSRAAAVMLQGMTAHYLVKSTFALQQGHVALIHAAAGGVGLLLTQMAKSLGARVIGTVGSAEKANLAREAGADEVVLYSEQDFEAEVKRLTGGKGVEVVYDSVGAATFMKSINCLRPRGMMVSFGNASGPAPPVEPLLLSQKGSLFLTRPSLMHYAATRQELLWRADEVLSSVASGSLKVHVDREYPLADAARAHIDLAGRRTTGKLLLRVSR